MSNPARRWIVIFALAALLFTALAPAAFDHLLAILPLLGSFFAVFVSIHLRTIAGQRNPQVFLFRPVLASRPPPVG